MVGLEPVAPASQDGSGRVAVRVLLISANTEQINMPAPPLGLGLVAAATRQAGHKVTFLDLLWETEPEVAVQRAIEASSPEVIGISVRNIDDQDMQGRRFLLEPVKGLVSACRARTDAPIILGGAGYSMFPDAALTYLDANLGICGEGEVVFPALLEKLQQGQNPSELPGVHVAGHGCQAGRQFAPDLDRLPLTDGNLWLTVEPTTADLWVPVQTRRGCALNCTYCSTADVEGRVVRARSPQLVAEHIRQVANAGFERFFFVLHFRGSRGEGNQVLEERP